MQTHSYPLGRECWSQGSCPANALQPFGVRGAGSLRAAASPSHNKKHSSCSSIQGHELTVLGLDRWSKQQLRKAALTGDYAQGGRTPSGMSRICRADDWACE